MAEAKPKNTASKSKKTKKSGDSFFDARTMLLILLSISAGFFGGWFGGQQSDVISSNDTRVTLEVIEGEIKLINTIANDVSPSVVSVNVTGVSVSQDLFGFGREFTTESAGTGFIISEDGLIVTNRHVVPEGTENVTVVLSDNTELDAEVVGRTNASDPLDIAFLKVTDLEDNDLVPAVLGNSDDVVIGERVVAIGNALGQFQNTVTSGIISGFGRDIEAFDGAGVETLQNLFQTDAAINSGNSGGPLVNSASEVIGINVATASAENISFAIPINDVKELIDIVLETGELARPYLGIRYVSLNEDVAGELGLEISNGVYIPEGSENRPSILPDSPAQEAGLQERDIIVEIDGTELNEDNSLVSILGKKRVGETVDLKVNRDGEEISVDVTLEATPE